MMHAGMRIARLNFSHGTHEEHAAYVRTIRQAERRFGKPVAILQDLQGPKVRVGELEQPLSLHEKESVTLIAEHKKRKGDSHIPVTHALMYKDVKAGQVIFIDDGLVELKVTRVRGGVVHATVVQGGEITSHKGINLPGCIVSVPSFTEKDHEDLLFGLAQGVDFVALSFVQDVRTVEHVRAVIAKECRRLKRRPASLIAKVENRQGVDIIEDIVTVVDGVLIARGDLAIELSFEEIPVLQKEIIDLCRAAGVPVIVATQMLHSMTDHPRATRAEVSDVANAVFDHADAIMLSQETAIGDYPEEAVQTMALVALEAEDSHVRDVLFVHSPQADTYPLVVAQSIATMTYHELIQAVVIPASHPDVLLAVNYYRPNCPIFVTCENQTDLAHWLLHVSVEPIVSSDASATYHARAHAQLKKMRYVGASWPIAFVTSAKPAVISLSIR